MTNRKTYSVSVPIDSRLYEFLERNKNNSKFFIEAAEEKLKQEDGSSIVQMIRDLTSSVEELKKLVSNGIPVKNSRKSIGDNRPEIKRGRR